MGTSRGTANTSLSRSSGQFGVGKGSAAPVPISMHPTKGVGHPTGGMATVGHKGSKGSQTGKGK